MKTSVIPCMYAGLPEHIIMASLGVSQMYCIRQALRIYSHCLSGMPGDPPYISCMHRCFLLNMCAWLVLHTCRWAERPASSIPDIVPTFACSLDLSAAMNLLSVGKPVFGLLLLHGRKQYLCYCQIFICSGLCIMPHVVRCIQG